LPAVTHPALAATLQQRRDYASKAEYKAFVAGELEKLSGQQAAQRDDKHTAQLRERFDLRQGQLKAVIELRRFYSDVDVALANGVLRPTSH
jgi:hypothetical protein